MDRSRRMSFLAEELIPIVGLSRELVWPEDQGSRSLETELMKSEQ